MENSKLPYALIHHDTDGVIKKTLAEDDRIEFWVDFVLLENGKDGDRIRGGQR